MAQQQRQDRAEGWKSWSTATFTTTRVALYAPAHFSTGCWADHARPWLCRSSLRLEEANAAEFRSDGPTVLAPAVRIIETAPRYARSGPDHCWQPSGRPG